MADATVRTPPEVARIFRVTADKVRDWIEMGELRAFNIARDPSGERPRWRIESSAIEEFMQRRAFSVPPPKPRRKKRPKRPAGFVEYFPE